MTVFRVSKLCSFRTVFTQQDSLAQADRCCNVKTSKIRVHHGVRLAAPLCVAVLDVEQSGVLVLLQVSAVCQCHVCAGNCKWRCACNDFVTFTIHGLLYHNPGLSRLAVRVSQQLGTHLPEICWLQPARTRPDLKPSQCLGISVAQHALISHRCHQSVLVLVVPEPVNFLTT